MYVCLCRGLKERDVRAAVAEGYTTREALIARFGWDEPTCCGRCARSTDRFLATPVQLRAAPIPLPAAI